MIQSARKPAFVHCYYGRDRTGAVIALYRMLFNEMSYHEALDEALHYKFSSENSGLKRTVHHYKNPQRLESLLLSVQSEANGKQPAPTSNTTRWNSVLMLPGWTRRPKLGRM